MHRPLRVCSVVFVLGLLSACTGMVDVDNTVVARIDDDTIRLKHVLDRISRSPAEVRLQGNQPDMREEVLNDLIDEHVLLSEADRQGITVTEEEVAQRLQQEQAARTAQVAAAGSQEAIPVVRDPPTIRRLLKIEKVVADHLAEERVRERYEAFTATPDPTVQYEFISIRLKNPQFAIEVQAAIDQGASPADLARQYRGHPDVLNGGRTDPVLLRVLEPWLQAEILRHEPGEMLPPYRTNATGEPTALLVKLLAKWPHPPYEVMRPYLAEQLYAELVAELRGQHAIEAYPERLHLIDRR